MFLQGFFIKALSSSIGEKAFSHFSGNTTERSVGILGELDNK